MFKKIKSFVKNLNKNNFKNNNVQTHTPRELVVKICQYIEKNPDRLSGSMCGDVFVHLENDLKITIHQNYSAKSILFEGLELLLSEEEKRLVFKTICPIFDNRRKKLQEESTEKLNRILRINGLLN